MVLMRPLRPYGWTAIIGMVCALLLAPSLSAQTVSSRLPSGTNVSAEFLTGQVDKPVVLVLHGFMTTRNFNTVQSLVNEVAGSGYTVLAPTLSLGIDNRHASVPCSAIHTHRWEDDIDEIAFWVKWLVDKGYSSIVLIGHSTGSLQLVDYVAGQPASQVKKVIATSLVNIRRYTEDTVAEQEIAEAKKRAAQPNPPLHNYHLAFCDSFTATPASYLSYIGWSRERVLTTLQKTKVPVEVIMGGADRRFSGDWIDALRKTGTTVHVIKGASHFFDATYEFDLLDQVQECLESTR